MTGGSAPLSGGRYWCGSYPAGGGKGIYLLERTSDDGALRLVGLAAAAPSPSFLARHPTRPVLYAALEEEAGALRAYDAEACGGLREVSTVLTDGEYPCHVFVLEQPDAVVVANYGSGEVVTAAVDTSGALSGALTVSPGRGRGPVTGRQEGPHAHAVARAPDGHVLTADLGADLVRVFRVDAESGPVLAEIAKCRLPAGSGPRHLAFGPVPYVYVLLELTNSVAVLAARRSYADLELLDVVPAFRAPLPADTLAAEIVVHPELPVAYASLREADRIAVLGLDDGGRRVRVVQEVACGGRWPRHFCLDGGFVYVANERSGTVTTLRVDSSDGRLTSTGYEVAVPSPVCLLPVPPAG